MRSRMALLVTVVCALFAFARPASAACEIVGVGSILPGSMNAGAYVGATPPSAVTVSLTVTLLVVGNGGGCKGEYGLVRLTSPARMSRSLLGGVTLPYGVTSGGSAILSYGITATARRRLPNFNVQNGVSAIPVTLSFTITPQAPLATPAAGNYSDQLSLHIFNREHGDRILVGQVSVNVTSTVVGACALSAVNVLNLNFSSDVATGVPAGNPQNVSFNVNCTSPSRVQLSGSALQAPGTTPSGAFDNFINYRAVANFGNASATLQTNGTASSTVTSTSSSSLTGNNLPVSLNIRLLPNRPLIGSTTYTGVLRVTVDPSL
jgi:hypothetical protein